MKKKTERITFNWKELREILKAFYTITGNRIVVFDDEFEKLAAYPERHLKYCKVLREDENARMACKACDLEGCRKCKGLRRLYMYECHAGLWEAVLPLMDGNVIIGYLMIGQSIVDDGKTKEEKWKELRARLEAYHIDFEALEKCFMEKAAVTEEFLSSAAKIMETCANHLYLTQSIKLEEEDLAKKIEEYISLHLRENLTVAGICEEFGLGRTKMYQYVGHSFGEGMAREIRRIRMREARRLLDETDIKISEVAARSGYPDYNYFTKIFKKEYGMTPRDYRKAALKANASGGQYSEA